MHWVLPSVMEARATASGVPYRRFGVTGMAAFVLHGAPSVAYAPPGV